jgi:NAD(P)H dehydrogenase (quinone)
MGFDPVSDRRNFTTVHDPVYLKQQTEELHASGLAGFTPDIHAEMEKLLACDLLMLRFPLWWGGLPAILKGWVDRVLACGVAYGGGRWFNSGVFSGKRAMCAITTGGSPELFAEDGLNGPLESILYPIHHNILRFVGFTVEPPFVVHAPARLDEDERRRQLAAFADNVRRIASLS